MKLIPILLALALSAPALADKVIVREAAAPKTETPAEGPSAYYIPNKAGGAIVATFRDCLNPTFRNDGYPYRILIMDEAGDVEASGCWQLDGGAVLAIYRKSNGDTVEKLYAADRFQPL